MLRILLSCKRFRRRKGADPNAKQFFVFFSHAYLACITNISTQPLPRPISLPTQIPHNNENDVNRRTAARYLLSVPAMFVWGIGTSTIGLSALGWGDTASAAALAVATIVIPAMDSFFAGSDARRCWGRVSK